jgi:hypothetical protein
MKNGKKFWKNCKKFGYNFSLISSIDRLDNGVIFIRKRGREGDDGGEVGARAVCSKF